MVTDSSYTNEVFPPGVYIVEIEGTGFVSSKPERRYSSFEFTLVDVCNPPKTRTPPTYENQVYTITTDVDYDPGFGTIDPSWCPVRFDIQVSDFALSTTASALTIPAIDTTNFDLKYITDLVPLGQSTTVTIIETTYSKMTPKYGVAATVGPAED